MYDKPNLPGADGNKSDTQLSLDSIHGPLFDGLGQPRALSARTHPSTGGAPDVELRARSRIRELSAALRVDSDQDAVHTRRQKAAERSRRRLNRATGDDLDAIVGLRGVLTLVR